jgi:hypothetical protein
VGGVAPADDGRAHASLHASCPEWSTNAPDARNSTDARDARGDALGHTPSDYGSSSSDSCCELLDIFAVSFQLLET